MDNPPVGSLVVPSPRYRETMGTGEGAALLLGLRRGSGQLFYFGKDAAYWVPMNDVRAIPRIAVPRHCLEGLLSDVLLLVGAEACQVEQFSTEERRMELSVEAPELEQDRRRRLEWRLRGRLDSLDVAPRNMSRITVRLRLVHLPAPAPAVT